MSKFYEEMSVLGQQMEEIAARYEKDCDAYWEGLSYEDKLKAFYSVCKRIHKGDVKEERSYRGVLYDVFGFDADAYVIGMECNYMDLHNYIQEGVASHKNYVEKDKNDDL
jgi:hypothetical protein